MDDLTIFGGAGGLLLWIAYLVIDILQARRGRQEAAEMKQQDELHEWMFYGATKPKWFDDGTAEPPEATDISQEAERIEPL